MDEKVREQRRGPARAAFLRTALISGPCDVEMRPFEPLGELGQECRGGDGTAITATYVREIREVALQLIGVLLRERQLPRTVIRTYTGFHELTDQILIVAHAARVMMPKGYHASAGQRRNIHDRGRVEAVRIVECVTQDQSTFRIRIQNLNGEPRCAGRDVPRLDRGRAGHVLNCRNEPDDAQ